jgi:DNA polymerase III epsilon subunit family exonuclease
MSGELGRYWWRAVWGRISRRDRALADVAGIADTAVLGIGAAAGSAPWTILPGRVDPATALDALDYLSLDTETTGLDPARDSIVAVGTVPVVGGRVDRIGGIELLVNPGCPIPPAVVAIHGIGDADVAGAPDFAGVVDRLLQTLQGQVALGHHIGFDFALLRRQTEAAGRRWTDLPALDTMLLGAVVWPRLHDLSLDALARRLQVETAGRHSACGDAAITAEVFLRLMPMLRARGILTLGAALAAQELARQALLLKIRARRWGWRWI